MKRFSSSALSTAITAAIGASVAVTAPANARDVDAPFGDSATLTGQVATAYYVAQPSGGWYTLINMTNTSDAAIAVKMRLKEYKNSREALDFVVMMSPKDVWTASISQNADGQVVVKSTDTSCVAPYSMYQNLQGDGEPLQTRAFYDKDEFGNTIPVSSNDGGSATYQEAVDRTKEGHLAAITMGSCADIPANRAVGQCFGPASAPVPLPGGTSPAGIGHLTEHVDGVPRNCQQAATYFIAQDTSPVNVGNNIVNPDGKPIANNVTYPGFAGVVEQVGYWPVNWGGTGTPGVGPTDFNPLRINISYLNVGNGSAASVNAMHFDSVINGQGQLITAQNYPWFIEPTIATAPSGQLWNISQLLNFEQNFTWTNTLQEWSVNPAAGVKTSIVMNFPTKGFHVDQTCNDVYASNNRWRNNGLATLACANASDAANFNGIDPGKDYSPGALPPTGDLAGVRLPDFPPTIAPFTSRWANGKSDVEFFFDAYDREEGFVFEGEVSPGGDKWVLPWEVARIVFDNEGGALGSDVETLSEIFINAADALDSPFGWINVLLTSDTTTDYLLNQGVDIKGQSYAGLPLQAFMVKTRDLGQPETTYGQGNDNGFEYCYYTGSAPALAGTGWECQP